jgi:hypothetical protein
VGSGPRNALEDRFLRAAAARLLVRQRHALDSAEQVVERGVDEQVFERLPVRGRDELHAALGDGARRGRLELGADLVDDDDLGHVVLDRLDHHRVLEQGRLHLHATRSTDAGMGDVSVTTDLVRRVDDDHAFAQLIRQQSRALAQHRGLADAGASEQENALARHDDVADDLAGASDRATDAHRQADDAAGAVANRRDAMERALDAGPVVVAELAHIVGHVLQVRRRDRMVREQDLASGHPSVGLTAEVEDDLQQLTRIDALVQGASEVGWKRTGEQLDLVVPIGCTSRLLSFQGGHPNDGTSPFSRTGFGTLKASSLTNSNCVSKTLNPRPRRASIMCES